MNSKKKILNSLSALVFTAGMLQGLPALAAEIIKIDGSSTVFPISEAVAEEFQKANKGLQVTVGISGTGGGFKKFCRGETDISDASRPILEKEMEACKKAGFDGTSVISGRWSSRSVKALRVTRFPVFPAFHPRGRYCAVADTACAIR